MVNNVTLPAVGAAGQRVVEGVEEEGVVTVGAGHPTHPRHIGQRRWHWGRGGQVDDPLTVWPESSDVRDGQLSMMKHCYLLPWTGDPLAAALADEETVAWAPHIFPPGRGVPDGRGLITLRALDNMLQTFTS